MSKKEPATQVATKAASRPGNQGRRITISEARRKAFEASDKARQAQITYAEEEAKRRYDYTVEE
jgi:hypothetical protein